MENECFYSCDSQESGGGGGGGGHGIMRQRKQIKTLDQEAKGKRYEEARIVSMKTECASFVQTGNCCDYEPKILIIFAWFSYAHAETAAFFT